MSHVSVRIPPLLDTTKHRSSDDGLATCPAHWLVLVQDVRLLYGSSGRQLSLEMVMVGLQDCRRGVAYGSVCGLGWLTANDVQLCGRFTTYTRGCTHFRDLMSTPACAGN
eukprot:365813-Chlamydomonas_euryale.AAC.8